MTLAHNLVDARRIVEEARSAKTIVAVAENWSYHSLVRAVGKYVQQGGIGEVMYQEKTQTAHISFLTTCVLLLFNRLSTLLMIQHVHTTPLHPITPLHGDNNHSIQGKCLIKSKCDSIINILYFIVVI